MGHHFILYPTVTKGNIKSLDRKTQGKEGTGTGSDNYNAININTYIKGVNENNTKNNSKDGNTYIPISNKKDNIIVDTDKRYIWKLTKENTREKL